MVTRFALLSFMAAVIFALAAWAVAILDHGWKTEAWEGSIGPFIIGQSKTEVVNRLSITAHASAIIISNETIFLDILISEVSQREVGISSWEKALLSDVWRFSPNVGNEFYQLKFSDGKLSYIERRKYFW